MRSRYDAVKTVGSRAVQESSLPVSIGGVANSMIKSYHGIFQVRLPLFNVSDEVFSEVCIYHITVKFPHYPLKKSKRWCHQQLKTEWEWSKCFAEIVAVCWWPHRLHVGHKITSILSRKNVSVATWTHQLQIMVKNIDSIRSFASGPYKIFTEIESKYHIKTTTFISDEYKLFKATYQVNLDTSLLHCKVEKDCFNDSKISYLT